MALTVDVTYQESADGLTLTFVDQSNWMASGVDINDYVRTVELYDGKDGAGVLLTTLTYTGTILTVPYTPTKSRYYSAIYTATTLGTPVSKTINFGTTNREYKALNDVLSKACDCIDDCVDDRARYGFIFIKVAEKALLFGNVVQFNQSITQANKWLTR